MDYLQQKYIHNVSVIIVTYNRKFECEKSITSLISQSCLPMEIIVIDDGSSKPFEFNHPLVKVFRNPFELGLSASRNIGVKLCRGDIIAFIDDDAIADDDWVKNIRHAVQEYDADIVGGPVLPLFLSKVPEWFDIKQFGACIGINQKDIIGCNIAIKRSVFEKIGYFNENLGRKYGKLLSGEETEFIQRAKHAKMKIHFIPSAIVYHIIYPHKLTLYYLLKRIWWEGVTQYKHYISSLESSFSVNILKTLLKKMGNITLSMLRILFIPQNKRKWLLALILHMGFIFATIIYRKVK